MSHFRWLKAACRFSSGDLARAIVFLEAQDDDEPMEVARKIRDRFAGKKAWELDDRLVNFAVDSARMAAANDTSPGAA